MCPQTCTAPSNMSTWKPAETTCVCADNHVYNYLKPEMHHLLYTGAGCARSQQHCRRLLPVLFRDILLVPKPCAGEHRGQDTSKQTQTHRSLQQVLLFSLISLFYQVAGVISSIIVLITVLKIGSLFQDLPKVTLLSALTHCLPGIWLHPKQIHLCMLSLGCPIHNCVCEPKGNVQAVYGCTNTVEDQQGWSGEFKSSVS